MFGIRRRKSFAVSTEFTFYQFFIELGLAGFYTVWSVYMNSFGLTDSFIGYFSAFLVAVSFVVTLTSVPLLQKIRLSKLLITSIIISFISYILLAFFHNVIIFMILASVLTITTVFRVESFDILFRDNTPTKDLNKQEGLLYSLTNLGWLVGPLIAGYLISNNPLQSLFYSTASFFFIALIILLSINIKDAKKVRESIDTNTMNNIKDFFHNKKIHLPYIMSMGIWMWWALVFIYVPLFMIHNGLSESSIGLFFAAVVIPLILVEYNVGKLSKKRGFKRFFVAGFFGLSVCALLLFFIPNIYLQLGLLVIASIFAGSMEPLQDTYFFNNVTSIEEEKFYPAYSTATDLGGFISKFSIATILLFLPYKFAFLFMALLMLTLMFLARRIKEK